MTYYAAFEENAIIGMLATRKQGSHIALFFVNSNYHHQGVGRNLFNLALKDCTSDFMTVFSSPYAVPIYKALGFESTDKEQVDNGIRYFPMRLTKPSNFNMNYRFATLDDLMAIVNIYQSAIENMNAAGIRQWDIEVYPTPNDIRKDIETQEMYVGTIADRIAVIYTINKEADAQYQNATWREGTNFLIIHRLCVAPEFQNQGVAYQTMKHIQDESRDYGIKSIHLDAFTQNPFSIALYEKLGYQKCGEAEWRMGTFNLYELLL